jgi:hypothetical protein
MADDGFNGSVADWNSVTLGPLRSISYRSSGARVNVSGSADAAGTEEIGVPMSEVTIGFVGALPASGADPGDKGSLDIAWSDGGTAGTITNVAIADAQTDGNMDGEILSQITLVASTAV